MNFMLDQPAVFLPLVCIFLFAAGWAGVALAASRRGSFDAQHASFKTLESAVLGLLALLLGFSFALATSRYDLRQNLEVDEANAIGTTWLRTDTMDAPVRAEAQKLLRSYGAVRLGFFAAGSDPGSFQASLSQAGAIQADLWRLATQNAATHRDPVSALLLSTVNDAIDLSEKRTAALENRIPSAAWVLLLFVGGASSALIGAGTVATRRAPC